MMRYIQSSRARLALADVNTALASLMTVSKCKLQSKTVVWRTLYMVEILLSAFKRTVREDTFKGKVELAIYTAFVTSVAADAFPET